MARLLATRPWGVQLANPIRPPGRHTRVSFVRHSLLIGREHRAERGQHDVERGVLEGERLSVGDLRLEREALDVGAPSRELERGFREVAGSHARAAPCGRQRGVAASRCDVEHALARMDVDGLTEQLPDDHVPGAYAGEVTAGPHGSRLLGELREPVRRLLLRRLDVPSCCHDEPPASALAP